MAKQKGSDFGSTGFSTDSLTVKVGLCIENGNNKHIHGMDDTKDGGSRGETSPNSEDSANKRVDDRKESIVVGHIPEEIFIMIFCKLPLQTLFQMQMISTSCKNTILGFAYFHNLWEQNNMQKWLVMELYDETSGSVMDLFSMMSIKG